MKSLLACAVLLGALAAPVAAPAVVLSSAPIKVRTPLGCTLGIECDHCLECSIVNVSTRPVNVEVRTYKEDGNETSVAKVGLAPGESWFGLRHCGEPGDYVCSFDVEGGRKRVRAAASEFRPTVGSTSATPAR